MMSERKALVYRGQKQPTSEEYGTDSLYPYLPSKELVEAVNITIYLKKRPLLIKGEPGSGKTRLARAVAYELGLPYYAWHIKSTSRARDGLYTYDAIRRLHDAQLVSHSQVTNQPAGRKLDQFLGEVGSTQSEKFDLNDVYQYIRLGPLGQAFQINTQAVLLIDEIDKADIDFPNDLLLELDEQRFIIEETGEEIRANHPPIVIITSNDEKDLPDAFLRRCIFHYIEFPSYEQLIRIISAHFPDSSPGILNAAVKRFYELREKMTREKSRTGKKVSTSELLDWFNILYQYPEDEVLNKLNGQLPFAGVLLKSWEDHWRYLQVNGEEG